MRKKPQPNLITVPRAVIFPNRCPVCGEVATNPVKFKTPRPLFIPRSRHAFSIYVCDSHFRAIVKARLILILLLIVSFAGAVCWILLSFTPSKENLKLYIVFVWLWLLTNIVFPNFKSRILRFKFKYNTLKDILAVSAPNEEWMRQVAEAPVKVEPRVDVDPYSAEPKDGVRKEDLY